MNDLSLAHLNALYLLINDLRDPTPQEIAIYKIAMKEAEKRNDIVTVMPGKIPGFYFRMDEYDIPWRLCDSVSKAFDQSKVRARLTDVYIYTDKIQERITAMYMDDVRDKLTRVNVILDDEDDLLVGINRAFFYGAAFVQLRPMSELEVG